MDPCLIPACGWCAFRSRFARGEDRAKFVGPRDLLERQQERHVVRALQFDRGVLPAADPFEHAGLVGGGHGLHLPAAVGQSPYGHQVAGTALDNGPIIDSSPDLLKVLVEKPEPDD